MWGVKNFKSSCGSTICKKQKSVLIYIYIYIVVKKLEKQEKKQKKQHKKSQNF
jgi:hypothetical protein